MLNMLKQLKFISVYFVIVTVGILLGFAPAKASTIAFDFDEPTSLLSASSMDGDVSGYMTDLYGTSVTVEGVRMGQVLLGGGGVDDLFLSNDPPPGTVGGEFSISFDIIPIVAVSFDWGVFDGAPSDTFNAFADGVLFFTTTAGAPPFGHLDIFTFDTAVTKLTFSDHGFKDIAIDNLSVTPTPEPSTIVLFGMGLLGMIVWRLRVREAE